MRKHGENVARVCLVTLTFTQILSGCSGGGSTEPKVVEPPPSVVTVTVSNSLYDNVLLSSGGTAYGSLTAGSSTVLTLPPRSTSISWTVVKRTFSNGTPYLYDMSGATLSLSQNLNTIDITNVVDGATYFQAYISSSNADSASFSVFRGGQQTCMVNTLGGGLFGGTSVTLGYLRLDADTKLRIHRGFNCTGSSLEWTTATIANNLTVRRGSVLLNYVAPPNP